MNENFKYIAAGAATVVVLAGALIYLSFKDKKAPPPQQKIAAPLPPAAEEPAIKHPIAEPAEPQPLPHLDESDQPVFGALAGLVGKVPAEQFVIPQDLVRHIVVTIDNLTAPKAAERLRPFRPVPGQFVASGSEEALVLGPDNYQRYKPMVQLLQTMDTKQLVAIYTHYYPLFQQAYENLGHPPQYFNDRVVEVIDHLLAAPDLEDPVALRQPNVQFEYGDAALESRSAGQKMMMRMGSTNAAAVKAKLREIRAALVEQKPR
jgi:hypothetical protein